MKTTRIYGVRPDGSIVSLGSASFKTYAELDEYADKRCHNYFVIHGVLPVSYFFYRGAKW